jgi:hypothetical protein
METASIESNTPVRSGLATLLLKLKDLPADVVVESLNNMKDLPADVVVESLNNIFSSLVNTPTQTNRNSTPLAVASAVEERDNGSTTSTSSPGADDSDSSSSREAKPSGSSKVLFSSFFSLSKNVYDM